MTHPDLITLTVRHGGLSAGTTAESNPAITASQVEGRNTVGGPVVEYGVDLHPSGPFETVRFEHGSIDAPVELRRVKLLRDHEDTNPVGVMTRWDPAGAVVDASFRLGRHPEAVEAAGLVEDEILDGFSVGIVPTEYHHDDAGTAVVTRAHLREVSLVAIPAISSTRARLGAADRKDPGMTGNAPAAPAPAAPTTPAPAPPAPLNAADLSAQIDALLASRIDAAMSAATAPPIAAPLPDGATGVGGAPAAPVEARATDGRIIATDRPGKYAAARGRDGQLYTAGDFLAAFALGATSGDWSKHKTITAALADETTTEIPGLLPYAIVGELLGRQTGRRPLWDSLRSRSMPMQGSTFGRPRITQHVKVDEQATQKTEVATQQLKVLLDEVGKKTIAGALDVAQQAIDWSSPSLLNELVADFVSVYIRYTDAYAAKTLVTAAKGTPVEWDGKAPTIAGVLATAAGQVYSSLGADEDAFPNTAWCSVDMWVALAGLADTTGRAMFPALGPANAYGRTDLARPDQGMKDTGFAWVVDKNLPEGTLIVGDSQLCETYENGRRLLQAVVPGVLGLDLAYMGYVASYMPYPKTLVPIKVKASGGGQAAPAKG